MTGDVRPVVRTITQEQIHGYADASGDHNPIHVDAAFARTTPFGGTIAHGMLIIALAGEMMYAAFRDEWLDRGTLNVRFKAPARPGDTVAVSARPLRHDGAGEFAVQCVNDRGEVLIEGRAAIAVPAA